jgi:DNA (cytosine-5)-methyltransferase 1
VLNTKNYGIPQNRDRLYIVGIKKNVEVKKFNWPVETKMKKLSKYIDIYDNKINKSPPRIKKSNYLQSLNENSLIVDFNFYHYTKYPNSDKICPCLTTKDEHWCVPKHRRLNLKEWLLLQGFPVDFIQVVNNTTLKKQIGNSMSINVIKNIFKNIL